MNLRGQPGFTLIELLVTMAVIAILAAIAYPTYTHQIAKARRAEIQAELMALAQFMERVYTETGCYNPGTDGDCGVGTGAAPDISAADDHSEYYRIAFSGEVTASSFLLQATPVEGTAQAADGLLRINQIGQRFWDENNDGDLDDADEDDWAKH
ncbi:MAG: type IV pilin protein [Thiohalocapsa sp.]